MVANDAEIRRREAADWFVRLNQRKVDRQDVVAFSEWRRDPFNAGAFERLDALWGAAGTLAHDPEIVALTEALKAEARQGPKTTAPPRRSPGWRGLGALAGALLLTALVGGWLWVQPRALSTAVGERRTVVLADGSELTLDTASRVTVRLRGGQRRIELLEGQASFSVAPDPTRPFTVTAGQTRVIALGTRFDVRRDGDGARVVLEEGRVRVATTAADWTLAPGQGVDTGDARPRPAPVDVPRQTSWREGRLIFERAPVSEAVAEVNRYSRHKIELEPGAVGEGTVSGAFDAGDQDGFLSALTALYPLRVDRAPDGHVVLRAVSGNNS